MRTSVKVRLYKQKKLKNGEHPIIIRITKNRKINHVTISSCKETEWNEKDNEVNRKNKENKRINNLISTELSRIKDNIDNLEKTNPAITVQEIIRNIKGIKKPINEEINFFEYGKSREQYFYDKKSYDNANGYKATMNNVKEFI